MKHIHLFESFDVNSIDMQKDFDSLNAKMFDGKLKIVPLRWMRTKDKLGVMAYDDAGKIKYVGISDFYKITRQQYLDVLAHEMIHVWLEQSGIRERDPHGPRFLEKVKELNGRFPEFNIKKTENAADYAVSGKKSNEYGVIIFEEDNDKFSVVVVNKSTIEDQKAIEEFIDGFKKYALFKFRKMTVDIYKSKDPELTKFKIKKSLSLRSMELFVIKPELVDQIKSSGELILHTVLK